MTLFEAIGLCLLACGYAFMLSFCIEIDILKHWVIHLLIFICAVGFPLIIWG